jgi:hypothetical protein
MAGFIFGLQFTARWRYKPSFQDDLAISFLGCLDHRVFKPFYKGDRNAEDENQIWCEEAIPRDQQWQG